ncbi:hypothetical protein EDB92DRAFT_1944383 [Lactarius akahatsu]|uniref:Uncharacterized protein n=1 Tax=Lactarius akahatsu TaxID=416441 RepID=A0AAD4QBT5_9AGAM|nr:hypothetical protein EDB92DRAFT_1944383 [Lactarius akahatsu]
MSPPKVVLKDRSSDFDKLSFAKYMKNIGRAYRKQAMELVSICRTFIQAGERSVSQDADLKQVLEVTDDALSSAADAKNKISKTADMKFEEAINALSNYEQKYHPKQQDATNGQQAITNGKQNATLVAERMKHAQENDKSSSRALNGLKQSFKAKLVEGPTKVIRFLLPGSSLPDTNPKVVEQILGEETSVQEILWNFSRLEGKKRITLKQNPHFYKGLPSSARDYSDKFTSDPIVKFWDATDEIWVLTDERSRVFLETDNKTRAFGNFWVPDEAIIFKEIGGRLEGERIVAEDIGGTPNLWHREEPTVIIRRRSASPAANPSDLPPIDTNPVRGKTFEDWRQLVRGTLNSPNISIRISTKGTPPESEDDWVLSSPTNTTPDPPTQSLSIMQERPTVTSSGARAPQLPALHIPEPFRGPQTAQSYKSAWSTFSPVFRTPLTEIPPSLTPPSTPGPRKPSAAAPPSPAKLTAISQDSAVAVLSSLSLTMTTLTPPQALLAVVPQRPEIPLQKPASAGLLSSGALTPGGRASSPQSTTLSSSTNDLARSSGLHAGDSHVVNRTSMTVSVPGTTKDQATSPGPQQARSAAAPVKGPAQTQKKKNWFQKFIWDYDTGK